MVIDPASGDRRGYPVEVWRATLAGTRLLISFQTRAEVLSGLRSGNWGERRNAAAVSALDGTPMVGVDRDVIEAFAQLSADCRADGHPLHHKIHTADRWVAACAIAKGLPLLARDGIYAGAPGVTLLEVPDA